MWLGQREKTTIGRSSMLLTWKYCKLMGLFCLVKALKIKASKLRFKGRFLNYLTLYIPDPKNEGVVSKPKAKWQFIEE